MNRKVKDIGQEAEDKFFSKMKDAVGTGSAAKGDKRVVIGEKAYYIEVKGCGTEEGGTVNQVRPVKYIPLVIYTPKRAKRWIVVPPQEVVRLAAQKNRGQHTEVPFESCTLSINGLVDFACTDAELEARVKAAIREGACHHRIRRAMKDLLRDLRRISRQSKLEINFLLEEPHAEKTSSRRQHASQRAAGDRRKK